MLSEFAAKIAVYEEEFLGIDTASDTHIVQDVLESKMTEFQGMMSEFEELDRGIGDVLDSVSDIFNVTRPVSGNVETNFWECTNTLQQLNEQAGTVHTNPLYQKLNESANISREYVNMHQSEMKAVTERINAKIKAEFDKAVEERKNEGIVKIIQGIVVAGGAIIGVAVIIGTGGAATPLAALALAGGATINTAMGASEIYEGVDSIQLANGGNIASTAYDPIRDGVLGGNRTAYGAIGTLGDTLFMAGGMMNAVGKTGTSGVGVVDDLAGRAEEASGANFGDKTKLESHFGKHGNEFKGTYKNADEYLQGARDVIKNRTKVEYTYKGEVRNGYVKFMGNNSKRQAKFEFVGTNALGEITTYHVESGKTFWKMLNGENIPVINPVK